MVAITGNGSANVLAGTAASDILRGLGGNDLLRGGGGSDRLDGGTGHDVLDGGPGNDLMIGGAGNDIYVVSGPLDRVVEFDGGGTDMVRSFVSFNLGATPRVENLALIGTADTTGTGTNIANVITGNNGKNILRGLAGNDTLSGNGGDDRLEGGAGADVLRGGAGNDVYRIDAGDTVIEFSASGPGDRIECPVGFSLMTAPQVEHLTLLGSASVSGTGNNLGNTIIGNAAVNTLAGNGGNDVLIGGAGGDTLVGGLGADIFRYHSLLDSPGAFSPAISDTVDLVPGSGDKIDLRAIDANVTNGPGNDVFIFVGPAFFTGPGQVRYSVIDAVFTKIVTIEANVDNTVGSPDFSVQFTVFTSGPAVLSAGDFML